MRDLSVQLLNQLSLSDNFILSLQFSWTSWKLTAALVNETFSYTWSDDDQDLFSFEEPKIF